MIILKRAIVALDDGVPVGIVWETPRGVQSTQIVMTGEVARHQLDRGGWNAGVDHAMLREAAQ